MKHYLRKLKAIFIDQVSLITEQFTDSILADFAEVFFLPRLKSAEIKSARKGRVTAQSFGRSERV